MNVKTTSTQDERTDLLLTDQISYCTKLTTKDSIRDNNS